MTPTCYLHVGEYKTGTTFLQRQLIDGREALRESGVLVPGSRGIEEHVRAGKVIMGRPDLRGQPIPAAAWYGLRDEMRGFDGRAAVYSYEELCAASRSHARRMVDDLAPADVRVVLTARDLVRVIPAAWQEVMQGGQQWTWEQFVDTVTSPAGRAVPPGRRFWRNNDLVDVVKRWADAVGPDHITLVTVPPSSAPIDLLWQRYCAAIDADPALVPIEAGVVNESLDLVSAELLRRFNVRAGESLPARVYDREVKWFMAKKVLAARSGPERVHLDRARTDWARAEGQRTVDQLRELGVRVQGDLSDLVGSAEDRPPVRAPTPEQMLDAALDTMSALVGRLGETADAERQARRRKSGKPTPTPVAASVDTTTRARRFAGRLLRDAYDRTRR